MTIPEIKEALNKQQALFEKLAKELSGTVENIKELRQQIGVPHKCGEAPGVFDHLDAPRPSIYDPLAATRRPNL